MIWISTALALIMGISVMFVRMKAANRPTSIKKIILPPLFMSTGALMFFIPMFRLTGSEIIEAVLVGMLFSILLIKTSNFEVRDDQIYLKRSKAFALILITLLVIRTAAKFFLSATIEVGPLGGMFFLLAFSMIVPWRLAMVYQFKKVQREFLVNSPIGKV